MSAPIEPDTAAAVAFLTVLRPEGPWAISAVHPDKAGMKTRTFTPGTEHAMRQFIDAWNGTGNLYYAVNATPVGLDRKATKDQITRVDHLHVDVDARAGEPLEEEIERIRCLAPDGVPPPTYTIMSGGGFNLLWALAEPIDAERAEACNKELERAYGGDACHDVSRVLRLPGTVNLPNAKKRERGRVVALAVLTASHPERVYTIDKFRRAGAAPKGAAVSSTPAAEVVRVADVSELDTWGVPERVKIIMAQGCHPDEPKEGDNSRSAWLFDFLCQTLRHGVPDEVILGIVLDSAWSISEHVLAPGSRAEGYARRQLERARLTVADFQYGKDEKDILPNQHNIRLAVHKMGVELSHDQFADRLLVAGLPGHGPVMQDEAVARLWLAIDTRFRFRAGKDFFWTVVQDAARLNGHHPVRDYLDGLTWDGTARVDTWLAEYGGAADNKYTRAVGSLMLVAAVRRVRQPGCKFDEMLVLISPEQGTDKSSALAALVPVASWFADDLPLGGDAKVVIERMHGHWIIEASELTGMRERRMEHLKAFLSRQVDRARMAYDRIVKEAPRQCVIFGSTNSEKFLRDTTGDRRFWPVVVRRFNVAALRRDRDQLWAEAAHREAAGESIRLDPALWPDATEAQDSHKVDNPFTEALAEVLGNAEGKLLAADAWRIVGVEPGRRTQEHNVLMGAAMRELGWARKVLRFGWPTPQNCYVRGAGPTYKRVVVRRDPNDYARWEVFHDPAF